MKRKPHSIKEKDFAIGVSRALRGAAEDAKKLRQQLGHLDAASAPEDMNLPGWRFHALKGELAGHFAVWVDENWRLTFAFAGEDAVLVDYQDYH